MCPVICCFYADGVILAQTWHNTEKRHLLLTFAHANTLDITLKTSPPSSSPMTNRPWFSYSTSFTHSRAHTWSIENSDKLLLKFPLNDLYVQEYSSSCMSCFNFSSLFLCVCVFPEEASLQRWPDHSVRPDGEAHSTIPSVHTAPAGIKSCL